MALLNNDLMKMYQRQRANAALGALGRALVEAGTSGRGLLSGIAYGASEAASAQPQIGSLLDFARLQSVADADRERKAMGTTYAQAVGGYDPQSGITWDTGRQTPENTALLSNVTPQQASLLRALPPREGLGLLSDLAFKENKAPTIQTFYDDSGGEYKASWNSGTGKFERIGGVKAPNSGGFTLTPGANRYDAKGNLIASAPDSGGNITLTQQRENAEIEQARKVLAERGLTPDDIRRLSASATDTGRTNSEYEEYLKSVVAKATQRKTGYDPEFEGVYSKYLGGRSAASALEGAASQPGQTIIDPEDADMDKNPSPLATRIGGMSRAQIEVLVNGQPSRDFTDDELRAIDSRLRALGY